MNKKLIILTGFVASVSGASAQGLVAGWDFAGVPNLVGTNVNGYSAEKTFYNNGYFTSGSIITDGTFGSSSLTQGTQTFFAANGSESNTPGFDTKTSDGFGGGETGQQSLNVNNAGTAFDVVFQFTSAFNVVMNMDWLVESAGLTTDILDISYSADGTNYTSYTPGTNGYWASGSETTWTSSDTNQSGLVPAFNDGQTDMTVDLSGLTADEESAISYIRMSFSNLTDGARVGIDNIHITGTAVPEPSAYAALLGMSALALVATRRRRK